MSGRRGSDLVCQVGLNPEQTEMLNANLGLIGYLIDREAKHLVGGIYSPADAFQDGVFGLARAVQKFDPDRGYRFSTFAMPHIFQAIQRGRGRCETIDWRRAYVANNPDAYQAPLSLDLPIWSEDGGEMDLTDLLPAPSDHAADVATDLASSALADGLRAEAATPLETELVEALIRYCVEGVYVRHSVIAARHGLSPDACRMRLRGVVERYRNTLAPTVQESTAP